MDILWKSIVGGVLTGLIAWLARKGNVLPGILPLFPTFGIIALYIVGMKGEPGAFRETCMASAKTIPAYVVFIGICYWAVSRLDFRLALAAGLGGWFAVALLIFLGSGRIRGG